MAISASRLQIIKYLRHGPGWKSEVPSPDSIQEFAEDLPQEYDKGLKLLYYKMASTLFKSSPQGLADEYLDYIAPWCGLVERDSSRYLTAAVQAYKTAWDAGMGSLTANSTQRECAGVLSALSTDAIDADVLEALPTQLLRGQVQSIYSRDEASETFAMARTNPYSDMIRRFPWDVGVLSYFSSDEVGQATSGLTQTSLSYSWTARSKSSSKKAIVVSVDPNFYRIYSPMMLFNAQQLPEIDFVFLLCADEATTRQLVHKSRAFSSAVSDLNGQKPPRNVSYYAVPTPDWVEDERTFYACARFLALPDMLRRYEQVYCMDADLIMKDEPSAFLTRTSRLCFSVPKNRGTVGIVPWRRHMAGSLVANRQLLESPSLENLCRYLAAGLMRPFSWTLDQNALSYAAELSAPGEFVPLDTFSRPAMVSNFMVRWEQNFASAHRSR